MITPGQLIDNVAYSVVRDTSQRESIVVSGRVIKKYGTTKSFQHFRQIEPITLTAPHVRLEIGPEDYLAIWADPTRPELRDGTVELEDIYNIGINSEINAIVPESRLPEPTAYTESPVVEVWAAESSFKDALIAGSEAFCAVLAGNESD